MLMTSTRCLPEGEGWRQEPKYDGWRCLAQRDPAGRVWLWTRHGRRYRAAQLPYLAAELAALPAHTTLDGELVALTAHEERVRFRREHVGVALHLTRPHVPSAARPGLYYVAFDVLAADGTQLTGRPWSERRAMLDALVAEGEHLRLVEHWHPDAERHERLVADGWEGSVFKRSDSRYFAGRRRDCWRKLLGSTAALAA